MMKNKCNHIDDCNNNTIIIIDNRYYGVINGVKRGICILCRENFILKVGDNGDREWVSVGEYV